MPCLDVEKRNLGSGCFYNRLFNLPSNQRHNINGASISGTTSPSKRRKLYRKDNDGTRLITVLKMDDKCKNDNGNGRNFNLSKNLLLSSVSSTEFLDSVESEFYCCDCCSVDYGTKKLHSSNPAKRKHTGNVDCIPLNGFSIHSQVQDYSDPRRHEINVINSTQFDEFHSGCDLDNNLTLKSTIPNFLSLGINDVFNDLQLNSVSNVVESEEWFNSTPLSSDTNADMTSQHEISTEEHNELLVTPLDDDLNTALHCKIIEKDETGALRIIRMATSFEYLNVCNRFKQTPLHLAVKFGLEKIVRKLMTAGSLVNAEDEDGNTPLHLASKNGNVGIVNHLVSPIMYSETKENRFQLPAQAIPQDSTLENCDGFTCFQLADKNGHKEVLDILMDKYD